MCPVCVATAVLLVAGATTTSGVGALAIKRLRARTSPRKAQKTEETRESGGQDGQPESRVAR
jgi:hypothetical protein